MRLVLWKSQERVDLPDMEVLSSFVLGEFRRTVRGLLIGDDGSGGYDNLLIQGFKVEQNTVPDSTVIVKLDPGGANPLSFAIAAENPNDDVAGPFDHGALMGGDDSLGNLEGNATLSYDFSGDPIGIYGLYARFIYADGENDNRAKWDELLNSESIISQDTRRLPNIELAADPSPLTQEWVKLADVDWGGATVLTADITDARRWAFEWDLPFTQTTKDGTGGMPDFSRSADRATNGLNEVFPALRALGRQIQDIKGQGDDGNLNWWSRPAKPWDPDGLLSGAGYSRSMRSLETVTFTIGDGVNFFGDWNGVDGLDDCLSHLEACTTIPEKIVILLRGADMVAPFNLGAHDFSARANTHLVIQGDGGNAAAGGYGRTKITPTTLNSTFLLDFGTSGVQNTVELRGLFVSGADIATAGRGVAKAHTIIVDNCELAPGLHTTNTSTTGYVLQAYAKMWMRNSDLTGRVFFASDVGGRVDGGAFTKAAFYGRAVGMTFSGCAFGTCIKYDDMKAVLEFADPATTATRWAKNLLVENCDFNGSNSTNAAVEGIYITGRNTGGDDVAYANKIIGNRFEWGRHTHGVDAGPSTTSGSGWCIRVGNGPVVVSGNYFYGAAGEADSAIGVKDAGCVYIDGNSRGSVISENTFRYWKPAVSDASARVRLIHLGANAKPAVISGNIFSNINDGTVDAGASITCIVLSANNDGSRIVGNSFDGTNASGYNIRAIELDSADNTVIANNLFKLLMNSATKQGSAVWCSSQSDYLVIQGNNIVSCGWRAFLLEGDYCTVSGNVLHNTIAMSGSPDTTGFHFISGDYIAFTGNTLRNSGGGTYRGIYCPGITHAFYGNVMPSHNLDSTAGSAGYNDVAPTNLVVGYV